MNRRTLGSGNQLLHRFSNPNYPGKVERAIIFTVEAWDSNCPQHIH